MTACFRLACVQRGVPKVGRRCTAGIGYAYSNDGSGSEAVCESTFRRACTALLTFPAYFRQNASTAFIRRRFSVVT